MVVGGFRSFHVLVTTPITHTSLMDSKRKAILSHCILPESTALNSPLMLIFNSLLPLNLLRKCLSPARTTDNGYSNSTFSEQRLNKQER